MDSTISSSNLSVPEDIPQHSLLNASDPLEENSVRPLCSTPLDPVGRHRRMGTSDYFISRSNAFRNLPELHNEAILNSPEESDARANQDLENSIKSVSEDLLTLLDTTAQHRCPAPLSPAQVDLNQVNILSQVLPVQQEATHPVGSDARDDLASTHEHSGNNTRSSRSTNRPRSYAAFHRYGKRN